MTQEKTADKPGIVIKKAGRHKRDGSEVKSAVALSEGEVRLLAGKKAPAGVRIAAFATTPEAERHLKHFAPGSGSRFVKLIIRETDSSGGEAPAPHIGASAFKPNARARALLRGIKMAQADLEEAGGAYHLEDVQALLNGVTRQAISKRVEEGSLLAVPGPNNRRRYPTLQFTRAGLLHGLKEVQAALTTRNPWSVLNFLIHPDDTLGGRKPIDLLREGAIAPVVSAARAMGLQGG